MGSAIPEQAFSGVAAQAQRYLEKLKRTYRVDACGQDTENMALCAMAETLWAEKDRHISSANVGSVSVHYDRDKDGLGRKLYQKASIYLDIYRGVTG